MENGISLTKEEKIELLKAEGDLSYPKNYSLTKASLHCIEISRSMIQCLLGQKEKVKNSILKMGVFFEREIRLCATIKGVSPFLVLAFLADVGDTI